MYLLSGAFDRIGRCSKCMRRSFGAAAFSIAATVAVAQSGFQQYAILGLVASTALLALSLLHVVAYFIREPAKEPCRSCAQARHAWARRNFRRVLATRMRQIFFGAPVTARHGACRGCGRKTPLEEMDGQPPADETLRSVVERSAQFALIAPRIVQANPVDSWQADMLHYYVYELPPTADGRSAHALFVGRWESDDPVSAKIFVEHQGGTPEVHDLTDMLPRPLSTAPS